MRDVLTKLDVRLCGAAEADRPALEALLEASGLPLAGLADAFPHGTVLAWRGGELVGAAALERWGEHGLLRSVAVAEAVRGHHVAEALVADRLAAAKAWGLRDVHLLTTSAQRYFGRFGFVARARAELPPELAGSTQLALPSCSTAVAMSRRLAA